MSGNANLQAFLNRLGLGTITLNDRTFLAGALAQIVGPFDGPDTRNQVEKNNEQLAQQWMAPLYAEAAGVTASPLAARVNLGHAADYCLFGSGALTASGLTVLTGDVGTLGAAAGITGFTLAVDGSGQFATSPLVPGHRVYAHSYTAPTPAKVTTANADMLAAYKDGASRTAQFQLAAGDWGGSNLLPGVYHFAGDLNVIGGNLTCDGSSDADVWIFQVDGNLNLEDLVVLSGGAVARNVFFIVAGAVTIGGTASCNVVGNILCVGAAAMGPHSGANLTGRLLAQGGVTLTAATITSPP